MKDVFDDIISIDSLLYAHQRAFRGKRHSQVATAYNYHHMSRLLELRQELQDKTYQPLPYRHKEIREPKKRSIEAPAYRDRIVQHAIHNVLSPYYERFFIPGSQACRPGKGIHHAAKLVQHFLRSNPNLYVCQLDVSKYYPSINHAILFELINRRIKDERLLRLLKVIIESTDSGTEHNHLFPPDSYYHTKGRRGIPIGNLTSQLFANIYLHEADMFAKQTLKVKYYVRYMDDILMFHEDKAQLRKWQKQMTEFLYERLYLTINPHKVRVYPTKQGVSFVGYTVYPHYMKLRGSTVRRFKRRYYRQLRHLIDERIPPERVKESLTAWKAHASFGRSDALLKALDEKFADYLFVRAVWRAHRKQLARRNKHDVQLSLFDVF